MDIVHDSNFIVYIRLDDKHAATPDEREQPVQACSTYAEARALQRQFRREAKECVIRFEGVTGGGD